MKNNFKLLTKLFSLILMLSLFGCEKDLYDDALTPKKELSVKHVSLKDLSRTENTDLFKKVDQVNLKRKNALGKIVYDSINHFYFDDENGKIIETADGYKSYTFPIIREVNDGKIENLLFSKNQNGSYDTYTVKYDFTEEELKNFSQEQIDQQAVTYQRFGDDIVCIDSMSWVSYPIDNGDLTGNFGYTGHWVVTSSVCEHLQPISNSSGGLGSTGWAGGGFTASNPTNQTGGIHTTPVTTPGMAFVQSFGISQETILGLPREVQQSIFDYLTIHHFDNITKARVKWFLLHYVNFYGLETLPIDSQVSIFNYFALNNYSTICAPFANEMITAAINNFDVDFLRNIIYGITKPCQKSVVKNLMNSCSPFINTINQTFTISNNTNINFSNGTIPNANAYTNPFYSGSPQSHTISIRFDNSYLENATNLSIAASTLHELVHAYLINLYLSGQLVATSSDYNTLLNAFIVFYDNQVPDTFDPLDNEIHNAMKDFIDKMANSLYNYAQSQNISVTPSYCEQMAWGTMYGTNLFQTVLTPQQQIDNGNATATEQDNLPGSQGTPCL
jgi:hypothetical protein